MRVGTWVAADGGIPQDRTGLNIHDDKADPDNQGPGHKMAVPYADVVQGRTKAHTSRKIKNKRKLSQVEHSSQTASPYKRTGATSCSNIFLEVPDN